MISASSTPRITKLQPGTTAPHSMTLAMSASAPQIQGVALAGGMSSGGSMIGGCPLPALERGHRAPHKLLNDPLGAAEPAVLRLSHPDPGVRPAQPSRFRVCVCFTAVCPPGPAFARLGLVE